MPRCWRYSLASSSTSLAIGSWCRSPSSLAVVLASPCLVRIRRFQVQACASSYFSHKAVMPVFVHSDLAACFHPAQLLLCLLPVQIVTGLVHGFRYFHRSARRGCVFQEF